MTVPIRARLLHTTNPSADVWRGRVGKLWYEIGSRCIFDGLMTSAVEGIILYDQRLEVQTLNSRYVFELEGR
jgi:hypothetical protein